MIFKIISPLYLGMKKMPKAWNCCRNSHKYYNKCRRHEVIECNATISYNRTFILYKMLWYFWFFSVSTQQNLQSSQ